MENNYSIFVTSMTIVLNLNEPVYWSITLFAFLSTSLTKVSEVLQHIICNNPFRDSIKVNDNLLLL